MCAEFFFCGGVCFVARRCQVRVKTMINDDDDVGEEMMMMVIVFAVRW